MLDIHSQMPGNAGILSNLHRKPFLMDGIFFGSMEGFLQGLRVQDIHTQIDAFKKNGIDAKRQGHLHPIVDQIMYYQGKPFNRHSDFYKDLASRAFECCFAQNTIFQRALYETMDMQLTHSIGKNDPMDTILTNDEFIGNLERLRDKYSRFLNRLFGDNNA